jgi:phosphoserine / homoserine phosphotransferase
MLGEAHRGIFFQPPESIVQAFPQFPVTKSYAELRRAIDSAFADLRR